MSLPAQKSKNDYNKYLNSYLATLNQSIQNNDLVYNAVSANLAGDMMAVPQMPQDTRSVEDKLRDIENLKVQLNSQLMSLTDGKTAGEIVRELNDFEIQQAVQSFPSLYATLKPLWAMGVPSVIFVQALRNLSQKQDLTAGIEMNLQQGNANTLQLSPQQLQGLIDAGDLDNLMNTIQSAGLAPRQRQGLLSEISYVKQLLFDKGSLPDRIQQAREIESMTGEDQRIPISVQEFLEVKGDFNEKLNELNQAIAEGNATDRDKTLKNIMDALNLPQDVIADLAEFDFNPSSTPSQKSEPSVKLQRKRLGAKLGARRGQAGAEEEKGQEREDEIGLSAEEKQKRKVERDQYNAEIAQFKAETQAQRQEQAKAERKAGEKIASKLGKIQRRKVGESGVLPSGRRYRIVGEELPPLQAPSEAKSPRRVSEEIKQARQGLRTPEAKVAQAEPVEAQVFSGKLAKVVEEGSYDDLIQQLIGDATSRNLALRALSETGGQILIDGNATTPEEVGLTGNGNRYKGNPNTLKYWKRTNVRALYDLIQSRKSTSGRGLRRMSGRGVSFTIKEEPQTKPKSIKLKMTGVIEKEPSYVPFGRYAVNKHKLASDIFMLRTQKGGAIPRLLTQKLSSKLSKIIKTIADKGTPSFEAIGELETLDKEILHKILQESQISSISTPNPSRDQDEKDHRRFLILKGELIAGNNNPALAKELKRLIIKLMSREILPRREAQNALVELAMLETI